jgi:regulator of sirC expression with transglutaminase-like and TPR domain
MQWGVAPERAAPPRLGKRRAIAGARPEAKQPEESVAVRDDAVTLFVDLVSRTDDDISLPAAALAIARVAYPNLDMNYWLEEMEEIRHDAAVAVGREPSDPVEALLGVVFDDYGFDGDRENYYDPRNSFLNDVLERKKGIPITLSLIVLEAADAAGLPMAGVGFPGHFIVSHPPTGRFFDPFRKGLVIDKPGFVELLRRQGLGSSAMRDDLLQPVGRAQMLARMLNNLRRHYTAIGNDKALNSIIAMSHGLESARESSAASLVQ